MARDKPKLTARTAFDLRHHGIDHRTQQARRFNTLRQSFAEQLPSPPTGSQDVLLTQAATFALLAEQDAARIIAGDPGASPTRFAGHSRRSVALLTRLGIVPKVVSAGRRHADEEEEEEDGTGNAQDTPEPAAESYDRDTATGLIAAILSTPGHS